jgi:hypothetical protein
MQMKRCTRRKYCWFQVGRGVRLPAASTKEQNIIQPHGVPHVWFFLSWGGEGYRLAPTNKWRWVHHGWEGVRHGKTCILSLLIVLLLTQYARSEGNMDEFRPIHLTPLKIAEIHIPDISETQISTWDVCSYNRIAILRSTFLFLHDGSTGNTLRDYPLDTAYDMVKCRGEILYLLSKQSGVVTIFNGERATDIRIPDDIKKLVDSMDVSPSGECILLKALVLTSYVYDVVGYTWSRFPQYHFIGEDGMAYFYNQAVLQAYDMQGRQVTEFTTWPYDLSVTYTIGYSKVGDLHLINEPLSSIGEDDDVEFLLLNASKTTVGYYRLKNGWFRQYDSFVYVLRDADPGVTITRWHIAETLK